MCVDQIPAMRNFEAHWVISQGLGFVPDHALPLRNYSEFKRDSEAREKFLQYVKDLKPDIAVSFQAPWWIHYSLWKAGVPVRVGVRSQWHSYLFLNRGLRQRRSQALRHEADYNRELLEYAISATPSETPILKLKAHDGPELLEKFGLQEKKYAVVHPGMAGSSLNWPIKRYIEFVEEKCKTTKVVLSGTPADEFWLTDLKNHFDKNPQVICLQNLLKPAELLTILEKSEMVLAPSTGIAHLAASLGAKIVSVFSPLRVQHPRRWRPRGSNVHVLMPKLHENEDPEKIMASISAAEVLAE